MKQPQSLLRTVGSISSATSLSRVLGLVRDQLQAYYFGAGTITDAFIAAFRVPNLFRDLFAEGALSSAFVPTLTAQREHHGDAAAWRLANRLITTLLIVLGLLTLIIAFGARWILRVYAAGFPSEKLELAVTMTRILSPFLLFVALAAVAMGVLNTCGRFFLPSLAPASFNVAAIAGMVILVPWLPRLGIEAGLALAIGALTGGVLQFLVQVPVLRAQGFRFSLELAWRDPALRRIARLMLPATLGLAATQINVLVDTMLASTFGDGPITYLAYAFRLMQLPIGLFGVALGTANLARVSRDLALDDRAAARASLCAALRAAALLVLPATCGLIALREPIVRVLFEHGRFGPEDTRRTAAAVLCYALGLFAYALTKILVPTFYALGDTRAPVRASVSAIAVKIATNLGLIYVLQRVGWDPFLGLALSTSLAAWVNVGWLGLGLRRHMGRLAGHRLMETQVKMLALSLVTGATSALVHAALERWTGGGGWPGEAARLGAAIGGGMLCVALGIRAVDLPESRDLFSRSRRR
jgi:putative peptidoglycan lipid II flippase